MKRVIFHIWMLVLGAPLLFIFCDNPVCIVVAVCWLLVLAFFGGRLMPKWMRRYAETLVRD